jgi:prepilin-type N-terminal cleavage/methylation domain-containing protein
VNKKPRTGFTIIEMIIVIAVIGVLVAILIPAARGVMSRSRKVKEMNLISHVGKAWNMYSVDHLDTILPGYVSTEVQAKEELAWIFPDETLVPPAPDYGPNDPNDAGPWPFRLLDYLDYDWESVISYKKTEWSSGDLREYANIIATEPAFGYNGFYLGGWQEVDSHGGRVTSFFSNVALTNGRRVNVVAKHTSAIPRADNQIVFCSTFFATEGIHHELSDDTPGTFMAIPSVLARVKRWQPIASNRIEARFDTYAPLGRYNGIPSLVFADGSVRTIDTVKLLDQSLWIPSAKQIGDVPASEFSHTMN